MGSEVAHDDDRIPGMFLDVRPRNAYFELEKIRLVEASDMDDVIENLIIYPEVTFLDWS